MGVQDAVLSMVVERPDYGYRIVKRLEDEWSSAAVYKALARLLELGLIERAELGASETEGRPRKHYRATARGADLNAARIARTIMELPGHREMLRCLQEAPRAAAMVVDAYERRVLEELRVQPPRAPGVLEDLVAKERVLVNEARLRWIVMVREVLDGLALA
jgi:DNA-binding PadR family transcriptional regulator